MYGNERLLKCVCDNDPSVTSICLQAEKTNTTETKALFEALACNTTLTQLTVEDIQLGASDRGSQAIASLARSLARNTTLTVLNLRWNQIDAHGAKLLAKGLSRNTTLTTLNLLG